MYVLAGFCGKEAEVQYSGTMFIYSLLLETDEFLSKWKIHKCTFILEEKTIMERKKEFVSRSVQDILDVLET